MTDAWVRAQRRRRLQRSKRGSLARAIAAAGSAFIKLSRIPAPPDHEHAALIRRLALEHPFTVEFVTDIVDAAEGDEALARAALIRGVSLGFDADTFGGLRGRADMAEHVRRSVPKE